MSRPTLTQLEYFVALADHAHFGRAAEACHVSQPALSSQIQELERRLAVTLVERLPRGMRLTPAGDEVVARARSLLAAADELVEAATAAEGELRGPFHLGVIPTVAPYLLGSLVPALVSRFPLAELRIDEQRTASLLEHVRAGTVDIGLCALPVTVPEVHVEVLVDDPFLLAVPAEHPLAHGRGAVDLAALQRYRVLLLEDGHCLRDQVLEVCERADASVVDVGATTLPTLVQMVAAGSGVTLLPASAAGVEARTGNGIVVRRLRHAPARTLAFVWRATSPRHAAYLDLARLVRQRLRVRST